MNASKKKYKKKVKVLRVELYPTDNDIKQRLEEVPAKATYVKKLIRKDIEK